MFYLISNYSPFIALSVSSILKLSPCALQFMNINTLKSINNILPKFFDYLSYIPLNLNNTSSGNKPRNTFCLIILEKMSFL